MAGSENKGKRLSILYDKRRRERKYFYALNYVFIWKETKSLERDEDVKDDKI